AEMHRRGVPCAPIFLPGNPVRSACDANGSGAAARAAQRRRDSNRGLSRRYLRMGVRDLPLAARARRPHARGYSRVVRRPARRAGATAEQTRPIMSRSVADPLLIHQAGAVIELVLNRPDKANALDARLVEALLAAVARAANSGARLLTLRGEGRHFCAGFDFSDLDQQSDGDLLHRFVRIEQLLQALHHAPLTTLALCH